MIKIINIVICLLFIQEFSFATQLNVNSKMNESDGAKILQELMESTHNSPLITSNRLVFHNHIQKKSGKKTFRDLYPNGDFVITWALGKASEDMTSNEYKEMWKIMNYLSLNKFRVILEVKSTVETIKMYAESETTSVMLISSHGNTNGMYDYNTTLLPYDTFANRSKSLYQIIISACYGSDFASKYFPKNDILVWRWGGETTTKQLVQFLMSEKWNALERVSK